MSVASHRWFGPGTKIGLALLDMRWGGPGGGHGHNETPSCPFTLQSLTSLNLGWVSTWLAANNINASGTVSGKYYQLTSQFPGEGPCNPVWVPTTNYFSKCVPQFNSDFTASLFSVTNNVIGTVSSSAQSAFTDQWNSIGNIFSRYVGDISKGIIIILAAGLGVSLILCMVSLCCVRSPCCPETPPVPETLMVRNVGFNACCPSHRSGWSFYATLRASWPG